MKQSLARSYRWVRQFLRQNWAEITKFLTVGGLNYLVDLAVFNLLLLWVAPGWPLADKCVAITVATTFSWLMNRSWTFRQRGGHGIFLEAALFVLVNVLGALPPLLCLWLSHYALGFTPRCAMRSIVWWFFLAPTTIARLRQKTPPKKSGQR